MNPEQLTIVLVAFLAGLGLGSGIIAWKLNGRKQQVPMLPGSGLLYTESRRSFWSDWFHGVSTEMAGAIVTAVLFTVILGAVQQQQSETELKRQLILQFGSPSRLWTLQASRELEIQGWLYDGTLKSAQFSHTDWTDLFLRGIDAEGAQLFDANLSDARLVEANLRFVNLEQSTLENTFFVKTDLRNAQLSQANLSYAHLNGADLQDADLTWTNLNGASFAQANLIGVDFGSADFSEETVLPDITTWTRDTDMARFTDPTHNDFWRPDASECQQTSWCEESGEQ